MVVPSDYPRLHAWYKADAITPVADGTALAQWDDSSGNGYHLLQAVGASQPLYKTAILNGLPVVRFQGTDDFMFAAGVDLTKRSRLTVYAVFSAAAGGAADQAVIEHHATPTTTAGGWGVVRDTLNRVMGHTRNASSSCNKRSRHRVTTKGAVVTVRHDRFNPREQAWVYVNGRQEWSRVVPGSTPVHNPTQTWGDFLSNTLYVGARAGTSLFLTGDIAELIVYGGCHTPTQRLAIEAYLATKWGITDMATDIAGVILFDGVSFTEGAPASPIESWPNYVMRNAVDRWDWFSIASQGRTIREGWELYKVNSDPWNDTAFPSAKRITCFDPGSNDIHYLVVTGDSTASEQLTEDWHQAQAEDYKADGWTLVHHTMMDRQDFGGGTPADFADQAAIYDTWLRANWAGWGDAMVDLGIGSATETRFSTATDTNHFNVDTIHQNDNGYRVEAEVWAPTLRTLGVDLLPFGTIGTTVATQPLRGWWSAGDCRSMPDGAACSVKLDDAALLILATPRDITHNTEANRPTVVLAAANGEPALRFDGSNDGLQASGPTDLSNTDVVYLFIVAGNFGAADAGMILEASTNSDARTDSFKVEHLADNTVKATVVGDVGTSSFTTTAAFTTGYHLFVVILDKSSATAEVSISVDGAAEAGTRVNANNTNTFGNQGMNFASRNTTGSFLAMDWLETVIWGQALSVGDLDAWGEYLCTKYGLTWLG